MGMLEEISERLKKAIERIKNRVYIDEKSLNEVLREIQKALILADVNVKIVFGLTNRIKERFKTEKPPHELTVKEYVIKIIFDELVKILGEEKNELMITKKPFKIMFIGLEGSGKTTTVAKLAYYYSQKGYKVGVFSTDIHRPAAIDQLEQLTSQIKNVLFIDAKNEKNVNKIIVDSLNKLDKKVDIILVDTAGRHKEEKSLLSEMKLIEKILKPDFTFLVIDATIGQKAYDQAKAFHDTVKIGGIIISKMDGTARGGGALSAATATGAKIYFIGTGEKIRDLEEYDPYSFVGRLLGIEDIRNIISHVERTLEKRDLERLKRISKGEFTLIDMIDQLNQIYKLGGLSKLLSYLPISNIKLSKEELADIENKIKKWKYAIDSMTLEEKVNPRIIKKDRLQRISRGSGVDEKTIKEMLRQYETMRKFMKKQRHKRVLKEYMRKFGY